MTILYERLITFIKSKLPESIVSKRISTTYKPCSSVTEMVTRLTALNWPCDMKVNLIIDDVDRIFQLDSNSFSVLLRLPEMVKLNISIIEFYLFSWIIKSIWSFQVGKNLKISDPREQAG